MKDKLILKDQTTLEIESGATLSAITALSSTKEEMIEKWDALTKENLSAVEVKNSEDVTIATYTDLILVSETSVVMENGSISTEFHLREKTDIEKLQDEVNKLKEGQEIQDGAIEELGNVVSDISMEA
jgi:hypothetical protein